MSPKQREQNKPIPDVECLKYHGTPEKPDIKIFVSHRIDLDSETINNPLYIPVRCGAVFDEREGITMLGDDTGDNISEKRSSFCELTVQYWAWKNIEADYYGFCHYRRYFSFSRERYTEDASGAVKFKYLSDCAQDFLLEDAGMIRAVVQPHDLLLSGGYNYCVGHKSTLYTQYEHTDHLRLGDMKCAIAVLKELFPEFSDSADLYMKGHILYPCNMFIMKRELFYQYSSWLFTILAEVESRIDVSMYSEEGKRTLAHISERLLGIYYTYICNQCPKYQTNILQRSFISDTHALRYPAPAFLERNTPIVFACSNFYAPYVAGTIQSIIEHASDEHNYDLIFLHTEISESIQRRMGTMVSEITNFSLRFYNIRRFVSSYRLKTNYHFSVETFYRLLIPQFLYNYDKTVYLDSDLIVLRDIADLYSIDIGEYLLAATNDADSAGRYNRAMPEVKQYYDKVLKLQDPYSYFQTGVMLFNLRAFRELFAPNELIEFAAKQLYHYADQDVLNIACAGQVYQLDMKWNVMTSCGGGRTRTVKYAPQRIYQTYQESRENPFIIHYAGWEKPWNNPLSDFADIYWKYARQTSFYEVILHQMMRTAFSKDSPFQPYQSKARKLSNKLLPMGSWRRNYAKKLLPRGSRRWNFCKKVYCKFFKR